MVQEAAHGHAALPVHGQELRLVALAGIVGCAVMVVTGAIATASGPHPGADDAVERLGLQIRDTVYVHVRATAVYGIGFAFASAAAGISEALPVWLALLIVAAAIFLLAAIAGYLAMRFARKASTKLKAIEEAERTAQTFQGHG